MKFTATLLLVFVALSALYGQSNYSLKSHKIEVAGTSNLHDWTAQIGKLSVTTDLNESGGSISLSKTTIVVDANSFISSKGGVMDKKIKETFESNKYPQMKLEFPATSVGKAVGKSTTVTLKGTAEVRKKSYPIMLDVAITPLANGDIQVVSSKSFKMSSLGLKAPVAMLGALKTSDDVSIKVNIILKKK
jgi:YceI-like domain.